MQTQYPSTWSCMAVVEVFDHRADPATLVDINAADAGFRPAVASPKGYQWFELMVDASRGEWHCARVAGQVLRMLSRAAQDGAAPELRIVSGSEFVDVARSPSDATAPDATFAHPC